MEDYLDTLRDATHSTFAARDRGEQEHTRTIKSLATAFFDAYVCEDARAKKWLREFTSARHVDCTAEFKPAVKER